MNGCFVCNCRLLPYLGKTIDKWHMKTRLAAGKNKGFKVLNESLMVQIEEAAREKLRNHTTEKFDDSPFYLQLLREYRAFVLVCGWVGKGICVCMRETVRVRGVCVCVCVCVCLSLPPSLLPAVWEGASVHCYLLLCACHVSAECS